MSVHQRVTQLTHAQPNELGPVLSRAFYDEPNVVYMLPDETVRRAALPWFFGVFVLRLGLRYGNVYTTETTAGGAIWMVPGNVVTFWGAMQAGLLVMPLRFRWKGFRRSVHINSVIENVRQHAMPGRHWYLMALGVEPSQQGKGLGSALLQPVLERADAAGTPCYLETFKESNLRFYAKHDFVVMNSKQIVEGGPTVWAMVRKPRTKDA